MPITAPRGTQDILPRQSYRWQFIERTLLETAALFGYAEIRVPTFESVALFQRGVGGATDVVQKEMFEVRSSKGADVFALRPEGTAGVVRAAIERGLLGEAPPLKCCYLLSCFRHERPQAGRLREFHQFGCECFGAASPAADAEMIALARRIFELFGLKGVGLHINSIGCPACRAGYYQALRDYFEPRRGALCGDCVERLGKNPMRLLDCKTPECRAAAQAAPVMLDYLCDDCRAHFEGVQARLGDLGIPFTLDSRIVRGLDYYTRTVFEFIARAGDTELTVCAGGRYDGLVEELGGKPTPGLGFGMGLERLLLLLDAQEIELPRPRPCDVYIGSMGEPAQRKAAALAARLREEGFFAECDLMGRSVKSQMKYADKLGALFSLILGETELASGRATLRDMASGEQKELAFDRELTGVLYDAMLAREADALAGELGEDAFYRIMQMKKPGRTESGPQKESTTTQEKPI